VLALKPQTFMNMSGLSVGDAASFYKIDPESVIVLHDDLDLDPGRVEVKKGGGHGGHNGLKSIDDRIGQDYWRIRLGLGHPVKLFPLANADKEQKQQMVLNHVLGNFHADELKQVEPVFATIGENIPLLLSGDSEGFRKALREASSS
jgi:PTH1 family peptidyl-tRNA hydrolase